MEEKSETKKIDLDKMPKYDQSHWFPDIHEKDKDIPLGDIETATDVIEGPASITNKGDKK